MKYFFNIENSKINGATQNDNSKFFNENYFQIEIDEKTYNDFKNGEIFEYINGKIVKNEEKTRKIKANILLQNIEKEILSEYPIIKLICIMCRINNYTDDDFIKMKNFIESKINKDVK